MKKIGKSEAKSCCLFISAFAEQQIIKYSFRFFLLLILLSVLSETCGWCETGENLLNTERLKHLAKF